MSSVPHTITERPFRTREEMEGSNQAKLEMHAAVASADKRIFENSTAFQKLLLHVAKN